MEVSTLPFTVENIEAVLHQFYNDVRSQAQANQYLILAQLSRDAWSFSWQLLDPSKPTEVQFFGASTLHSKISKYWNEVPPEQYEELRLKLMQAAFAYINGPKFILTRLCVALSSFVIQTLVDFWPSAINDLMVTFLAQETLNIDHNQLTRVLLELLTVLSEEVNTTFMSRSKTKDVNHALETSFNTVMTLVEDVLSKNTFTMDTCEMALKCYSSWSQIGSAVFECHSLLVLTFDAIYREELSQTALETVSNVASHPLSHKYPNVILMIVENITKFDTLISETIYNDDMVKLCCIYAMIISILDTHTNLLLNTILEKPEKKNGIMKVIDYVMKCSSTPGQYPIDETCSEQAFGFWYGLQDQIVSSEAPEFEKLLLVFHPVFNSLLDTYLTKLKYPSDDVYQQWNTEEKEAFRCYRQDIGDSIMFCYNILKHAALSNLTTHLTLAITTVVNDSSQWQYLEACLFAFKEIAPSVDANEQSYISMFMSQLPNIPICHLKVASIAMQAIGAYALFINLHPDVMGFVIPLLLMGLKNTDTAPAATFALKDITHDCYSSLKPHAEKILSACQDALKENVIMPREKVRLMSTIGHVLSITPYSQIISFLEFLLPPILQSFQNVSTEKFQVATRRTTIVLNLHMLSSLFGTLDTKTEHDSNHDSGNEQDFEENYKNFPQPVVLVMQQVLPIFQQMCLNWEPCEQITEAISECLRKAISTLLDEAKPFVSDVVQLILHLYRSYAHVSVLDLSQQLFVLFANDEDQSSHLSSLFKEICSFTLSLAMEDFRESTSVLEIFFRLLSQVLKKALVFFKNDELNLQLLFECGISALSLPEKPTVKAAASFLTEFITYSREVPVMLDAVNNCGEKLVIAVIKVIGGESPRAVVDHMPDVLMALNKKYFDNLCRWLNSFVQNDSFLPNRVSQSQREQFTRLVLKERTNKRKLKETVTEFSLLCRGLIGTEYANGSSLQITA